MLEVGPGLGVLTRYLAERVAHVHAVEIDRSLEPRPRAASPGTTAPLGRRARARPGGARPAADEARREPAVQHRHAARRREPRPLPELGSVVRDGAARGRRPLLRRRRARRPTARSPCSSSSRPSAPASTPSRARCSARGRTSTRRSSPFARIAPGVPPEREARRRGRVRAPPQDARQLARARGRRLARARRRQRSRRSAATRRPAPRSSSRAEFVALAARPRDDQRRRAGEDQPRARRRPARADGLHEVATVLQRIDLCDTIVARAGRRARRRGLRRRHARPRARSRASRPPPASSRAGAPGSRSGSRSPPASAAAAPTPRRRSGSPTTLLAEPLPPERLHELARGLGADVAVLPRRRARSSAPATARPSSRSTLPQDYAVLLLLPDGADEGVDRRRLRPLRRRGGLRRAARARARDRRRRPPPRDLAALPPNDLAVVAARCRAARRAARSAPTSAAPARRSTASSPTGRRPSALRPRSAHLGRIWVADPAW